MKETLLGPLPVAPAYPYPFACIICNALLHDQMALHAAVAKGCPGRGYVCSQATGTLPAIQRRHGGSNQ